MPAITCKSVVLPQPLRPISAICSPAATLNSGISRIGSRVPSGCANDFLTFFKESMAAECLFASGTVLQAMLAGS
jgi:hypothetical protein